jgi:hypothetical protein
MPEDYRWRVSAARPHRMRQAHERIALALRRRVAA